MSRKTAVLQQFGTRSVRGDEQIMAYLWEGDSGGNRGSSCTDLQLSVNLSVLQVAPPTITGLCLAIIFFLDTNIEKQTTNFCPTRRFRNEQREVSG